jgi:hypothetical protein
MLRLIVLLFLLAPATALASGGESKPAPAVPSGGPLAGSGPPNMDMPAFMAPVTVAGALSHYVYLVVRFEFPSESEKSIVREKVPYIQDAFLRDVHAQSIALNGDPEKIDEAGLAARLKAKTDAIVGPNVITSVGFGTITRAN